MCCDYMDICPCDLDQKYTYYVEDDTLHVPVGGGCAPDSAQCDSLPQQLLLFP